MGLTDISVNFGLDLYDHDTTPTTAKANALDSQTRVITAQVFNGGATYDVDENADVSLIVMRPDKVAVEIMGSVQAYDIDGATVYGVRAELSQASLAVDGEALGQFLLKSDEQELRTEVFTINIGRALDADTSEWAGEYQGYDLEEFATVINGVENMTVTSQTLPQGASATVTKTEDEDGIINLDFGLPLASGEVQVVNVTGTNPTITAEYNKRYVCGEVATLTITPATQGCTDVLFTSGTTPTVLSLPNTVKMPSWFTVEANKTYEISILDGVYGAVMAWT